MIAEQKHSFIRVLSTHLRFEYKKTDWLTSYRGRCSFWFLDTNLPRIDGYNSFDGEFISLF